MLALLFNLIMIIFSEPKEIELHIDGKTDPCVKGQDINFKFTGFSVTGLVSILMLC